MSVPANVSLTEPKAILKNLFNSLSEYFPLPSAIFKDIDNAERII